jgi:hypothetical protein
MANVRPRTNPFYAALVLLGVAFTVTACAYAVMTYRALDVRLESAAEKNGLMSVLSSHGAAILGIEVLLLAIATVGAIGLDQYRQIRAQRDSSNEEKQP